MPILIRTSDVPAAHRHDAWRSIVCETLGPLEMRSDPDTPLTATPHSVHRTPGLIRRGHPELYRVAMAVSGSLGLAQDGRVARLRRGEFTIYDFSRPYELAYDSGGGTPMVEAVQATAGSVAALRAQPFWPDLEAAAPTLAYEAAVMGPGNVLPAVLPAAVAQPTLVLNGGNSPAWMTSAGQAVAGAMPRAAHRILAGQAHNVAPGAIVPELMKFFAVV